MAAGPRPQSAGAGREVASVRAGIGGAGIRPTELASGRYQFGEALGSGSFATVYRARDTLLGVERAVKVLNPRASAQSSLQKRFLAEARAMAALEHPHVLRVFDVGIEADQSFVVMALAPGGSLADRLGTTGGLGLVVASAYAVQILSALGAAHAAGIVHRDVKPENVLIGADNAALLADFGIALVAHEEALRTTRTGVAMGSMAFMAPEQRLDARGVGPPADLYAVGASLFNLLTGKNAIDLFAADTDSDRWAAVPSALRAFLRKSTSYTVADRYQTAAEMAVALQEALAEAGITTLDHALEDLLEAPDTESRPTLLPDPAETRAALTWAAELVAEGAPPPPRVPTVLDTPAEAPPTRARRWPLWLAAALPMVVVALALGRPEPSPTATEEPTSTTAAPETVAPSAPEVAAPEPEPAEPAEAKSAPAAADPDPAPAAADPDPAPVTAPPPPKPRPAAHSASGRWSGSFGGRTASLQLSGPSSALTGQVGVTVGGRKRTLPVSGSHDPASGSLVLSDQDDSPDAGRYTGQLDPDTRVYSGTFTTHDGARTVPFRFRPSGG